MGAPSRATSIRSAAVRSILAAAATRPGAPRRILAAAGLVGADVSDPDRLVEVEALLRLINAAAGELVDESLGMRVGAVYDFTELGILSHAVLNASTVGVGLRNLEHYGRLHVQGGRITLRVRSGEALLGYTLAVADPELARQYAELAAVFGFRLLNHLAGNDVRLRRVLFGHRRPRDVSGHQRVFQAPLGFEEPLTAGLVFDAAVLKRSVDGADPRLLPIVERHLNGLLTAGVDSVWLQQVRRAIAAGLCDASPKLRVRELGKKLAMSVRTVQRRLAEQGVDYKGLVREIRRDLAYRYLAEGDESLTEIAFLLGYSELSAFDRAFRCWTGSTPLEVRQRLRPARRELKTQRSRGTP